MDLILSTPSEVENVICEEVVASEIKDITENIKPKMEVILKDKKGIGLAAPQIGIKKKFFVMMNNEGAYDIYFNPKYFKDADIRIQLKEGCLTYPDQQFETKRWKRIRCISYILENNELKKKIFILKGLEAIAFQHETDHLSGITIAMR